MGSLIFMVSIQFLLLFISHRDICFMATTFSLYLPDWSHISVTVIQHHHHSWISGICAVVVLDICLSYFCHYSENTDWILIDTDKSKGGWVYVDLWFHGRKSMSAKGAQFMVLGTWEVVSLRLLSTGVVSTLTKTAKETKCLFAWPVMTLVCHWRIYSRKSREELKQKPWKNAA